MAAVHLLLEETRSLLAAPLTGCSAEQTARHPGGDPSCWNARQVIEHLSATWQLTTDGVQDRLRKGRPLMTRPSLAQQCAQLAVCRLGYFPKGRKAPPAVDPHLILADQEAADDVTGDGLIAHITASLDAMDRQLNSIEPQTKDAPVLTHLVLGPLSVDRWRRFHRVHARHHVAQIKRAIQGA